jgi:hypothetical protein
MPEGHAEDRPKPTSTQLWEQDRALLAEYGHCHIETICGAADALCAEGRYGEAAELDQQCARMRILILTDHELLALYQRVSGEPADDADLILHEIERRGLDL